MADKNALDYRGSMLTREDIRSAPKVLLHDHLDGGVRPQTIIEIGDEIAIRLDIEGQREGAKRERKK